MYLFLNVILPIALIYFLGVASWFGVNLYRAKEETSTINRYQRYGSASTTYTDAVQDAAHYYRLSSASLYWLPYSIYWVFNQRKEVKTALNEASAEQFLKKLDEAMESIEKQKNLELRAEKAKEKFDSLMKKDYNL